MKKFLCLMLAYALCVSMFTYATAEENKEATIPVTVFVGPFSFELPDGWEVCSFDSDCGFWSVMDSIGERYTPVHLELCSSDGEASITIKIIDSFKFWTNQINKTENPETYEILHRILFEKTEEEENLYKELFRQALIEVAKQNGKTYKDIFECRIGEYNFMGIADTDTTVSNLVKRIFKTDYETNMCFGLSLVGGNILSVRFSDPANNHSAALRELLNTFKENKAYTYSSAVLCGPVLFDTDMKWEKIYRHVGGNCTKTEFISISDPDTKFLLTIYNVWPELLAKANKAGVELNMDTRYDCGSLELAIEYLEILVQEWGADINEIENCRFGEYDFCRLIVSHTTTLNGDTITNVPIYGTFIDGYMIFFTFFQSEHAELLSGFTDVLNSINISHGNALNINS